MENIISERVISERIIRPKNNIPIIGGILNRFNTIVEGFMGLCMAPVLILAAFGVLLYSENFSKDSQIVSELQLKNATEISTDAGLQKFTGKPSFEKLVEAPNVGEVLYFEYEKEQYKQVEEIEKITTTETRDGQQVEKVVEQKKLVDKWVSQESDQKWADFKLGSIEIDPENAKLRLDLVEKEFLFSDLEGYKQYPNSYEPEIGDIKISVKYFDGKKDMIVIGEVSGSRVSGGSTFIVSNKTDAELLRDLENTENVTNNVLKFVAFVLYFIGFMSIFRPLIAIADSIPFAGKAATFVASVVSLILAVVSVVVVTIFIKLWWLIVIVGVCLVGILLASLAMIVVGKKVQMEEAERDRLADENDNE